LLMSKSREVTIKIKAEEGKVDVYISENNELKTIWRIRKHPKPMVYRESTVPNPDIEKYKKLCKGSFEIATLAVVDEVSKTVMNIIDETLRGEG